jgi:thymidine kinase
VAKLYFYYSTMNAGKSTALLQASHNYRERGMRTLVYTAAVDDRGGGRVHSRIGISGEAHHFAPADALYPRSIAASTRASRSVACCRRVAVPHARTGARARARRRTN